ncbi:MAG: hypothetical protein OEM52_05415 [bacterium]|nr:hypothetical protein [bacterium]
MRVAPNYRMSILVLVSGIMILSSHAQEKSISFSEGITANGARLIVLSDSLHSTTTIVFAFPRRYTIGFEKQWRDVVQNWVNGSPYRHVEILPTPNKPYLMVHSSRADDYNGLTALLDVIRQANWEQKFRVPPSSVWPDPAWFFGKSTLRGFTPHPSEFVVGVAGIDQTSALWNWAENALDKWVGKTGITRMPPVDTVGHFWFNHTPGERTEIVMWQPVPIPFSKPDAVLRDAVLSRQLERRMLQTLEANRVAFTDFALGLFPETSPQWIWCALSGSPNETESILRELPYAWLDVVSDTTFPVVRKKVTENHRSRDQKLMNRCLAKMYATPTPPSDPVEYRKALQNALLQDRWTILVTTDTMRVNLPEIYRYHP